MLMWVQLGLAIFKLVAEQAKNSGLKELSESAQKVVDAIEAVHATPVTKQQLESMRG